MEAMEESTDGFLLAERDLEIRGSGQVLGERQAGHRRPEARSVCPGTSRTCSRPATSRCRSSTRIRTSQAHRELAEEVEDLLGDSVEFLFKS